MRGIDLQIQFERVIQEMNDAFISRERPDTFTVYKFINQAQIRYLNEKYISFKSVKENIEYIQQRAGDLNSLIKTRVYSTTTAPTGLYYGKAKYIKLLDDYVYYIRSDSYLTRSDAIPVLTATYIPNKTVSYSDLSRLLQTPWNIPILRNPIAVFEENDRIYLIHDSYTNTLTQVSLTYLRRPYNFDTNYSEFTASIPNATVPVGTRLRAITAIADYVGAAYSIGDYFTKTSGYNSIGAAETVCSPHDAIGVTTECEFPYQVHDEILNMAVSMYVEEAKYRLNILGVEKQKANTATQ